MFLGLGISLSARFLFDSMAIMVCYCVTYKSQVEGSNLMVDIPGVMN